MSMASRVFVQDAIDLLRAGTPKERVAEQLGVKWQTITNRARDHGGIERLLAAKNAQERRGSGAKAWLPIKAPPMPELDGAACKYVNPEIFFPINADPEGPYRLQAALRTCEACPVRVECLAYAMETGVSGIWGGTTGEHRDHLRATARMAT